MIIPPRTITVFTSDSDEFASLCAKFTSCDIGEKTDRILIKCESYGRIFKIIYAFVCLVFFAVIIFSYFSPYNPIPNFLRLISLLGLGYLVMVFIYGYVGDIWFFFSNERLFVKRWIYIFPWPKNIILEKNNIHEVSCIRYFRYKAPVVFFIEIIDNASTVKCIMKDVKEKRARWLSRFILIWTKSSTIQDVLREVQKASDDLEL